LFVQQSVIDQSCHQHYRNGYPWHSHPCHPLAIVQ
jgi:hypothetical protein